jgi:uncharacterized protein YbaR (Trm112 family)
MAPSVALPVTENVFERPVLINAQLLEILRCPQDQTSLTQAEQPLVDRANRQIAAGGVVNLAGQAVPKTIDGGLIRAAGDLMYLVIDGIPVMLPDEAIELAQLSAD